MVMTTWLKPSVAEGHPMDRRQLMTSIAGLVMSGATANGPRPARAQPSNRLNALVFDAYGTLFDVYSVAAACETLFPGRGQAVSQQWRAKQLEYTWLLSLMGRYEDFWRVTERALRYTCASMGLGCTHGQRENLMESYLHLAAFAEAEGALRAVASYPLAILSNGSPRMLSAAVSAAGFGGFFREVISVDVVRVYKPSPRVYRLASDRFRTSPGSIGFVSSNAWDVHGAKAFGFWTCWVNRTGMPAEELDLPPDVIVKTLAELPAALRGRAIA